MGKSNRLDEMPFANLSPQQLKLLRETEANLSGKKEGEEIYLIAYRKNKNESRSIQ